MVENRASTRVMEKLGMQPWRTWTGKQRAGGEWSAVTYALARGRVGSSGRGLVREL
jgi:RimJ/RimL family protein N-acetyltransferase